MKRWRIAVVRSRYNPFGGAERFVERALATMGSERLAMTVITRSWPGGAGYDVIECNPPHMGRLWRDWSFARCVTQIAGSGRYDLVQSHERIPGCDIYRAGDGVHATWLALRGRTQSSTQRVATRLNLWHRYTLSAEARMFRHPALRAVICNARMVRDDIAQRFGLPHEKLHVIYNGVDTRRFAPEHGIALGPAKRAELGIPDDAPLFVYVGSGFERKGVSTLLDAFRALPAQAHLWLVGHDKHARRYVSQAAAAGLGERVRFLGGQPDVRPFLAAADAFVLPTLYDPQPNAALEAMACGLPVITTHTCGSAELIAPGQSGYICEPLDSAALAQCMSRLLDRSTAAAMGLEARRTAETLDVSHMVSKLVSLYGRLLGEGESPASQRQVTL